MDGARARRGRSHAADQPPAARSRTRPRATRCSTGARRRRWSWSRDASPSSAPEPSGLASMVADLIEQNLARDPGAAGAPASDRGGARRAGCRRHGVPPDRARRRAGRGRRRARRARADPSRAPSDCSISRPPRCASASRISLRPEGRAIVARSPPSGASASGGCSATRCAWRGSRSSSPWPTGSAPRDVRGVETAAPAGRARGVRPAAAALAPHGARRARDVGHRARRVRRRGDAARAGAPAGRARRRPHGPPAPGLGGGPSRTDLHPVALGRQPSRASSRSSRAGAGRSTSSRCPAWAVTRSSWRTCTRARCSASQLERLSVSDRVERILLRERTAGRPLRLHRVGAAERVGRSRDRSRSSSRRRATGWSSTDGRSRVSCELILEELAAMIESAEVA